MLEHTITTTHNIQAIQDGIARQGYYLANNGKVCGLAVLSQLADELGGIWQQGGTQTIAPASNARFIAQTTEAIPPHNECAYSSQPPRYLLLHCRENTVAAGDFYLVDSADVIGPLTAEATSLFYHSQFECLIDPAHPQQVTLLKQNARSFHLQYTCIGHSDDWLANISYRLIAPFYPDAEHIIPFIQQQLKREELRQHHSWQAGDLLIVDNQRYLHGREVFTGNGRRLDHIRIA